MTGSTRITIMNFGLVNIVDLKHKHAFINKQKNETINMYNWTEGSNKHNTGN